MNRHFMNISSFRHYRSSLLLRYWHTKHYIKQQLEKDNEPSFYPFVEDKVYKTGDATLYKLTECQISLGEGSKPWSEENNNLQFVKPDSI